MYPFKPASPRALASRSRLTLLVAPGELDEPVALDRGVAVDGLLGFGDLLIDAAQGAPGPVVTVLVVDDPIRDAAGLLAAGGRPRLGEDLPVGDVLAGMGLCATG